MTNSELGDAPADTGQIPLPRFRWLSEAVRERELAASAPRTGLRRLQDWLLGRARRLPRLSGVRSSVFVPQVAIALLYALTVGLPPSAALPDPSVSIGFIHVLWQVTAALVGVGLVVLVPTVQLIGGRAESEYVWRTFVARSHFHLVLSFMVGVILAAGATSIMFLPSAAPSLIPLPGLRNLVALNAALVALLLASILFLYEQAFQFMRPGYLLDLANEALHDSIRDAVITTIKTRLVDQVAREEFSRLGLVYSPYTSEMSGMRLVEIRGTGLLSDINLHNLAALCQRLPSHPQRRGILTFPIGRITAGNGSRGLLLNAQDISQVPKLPELATNCFKFATVGVRQTIGDLEVKLGVLTGFALDAIRGGKLEALTAVLNSFLEAMGLTLSTFGRYMPVLDREALAELQFFQWLPSEEAFHQYVRILEAAAQSDDKRIALEAASWIRDAIHLSMTHNHPQTHRRAANFLPYVYRLALRAPHLGTAEILKHRARLYLSESMHYDIARALVDATNTNSVEAVRTYASTVLDVFADLLKIAIDACDLPYFKEAANSFWQCVDDTYLSHEIQHNRRPRNSGLPDADAAAAAKQQVLVGLTGRQRALWVDLGAWLCRSVSNSPVVSETHRAAFRQIAAQLRSASDAWTAFGSALQLESTPAGPLSRWEIDSQPEGEARRVMSDQALALFFTLVALSRPLDSSQVLPRLTRDARASLARDQIVQALSTIQEDHPKWEDLTGRTGLLDQAETLSRLVDAAAREEEAYEQRCLETEVRLAPFSADRMDAFVRRYLDAWREIGTMRGLLCEVVSAAETYELPPGSVIEAQHLRMPKALFVDHPRILTFDTPGWDAGVAIAHNENARLLSSLRRASRPAHLGTTQLNQALLRIVDRMTLAGTEPDLILFTGEFDTVWQLHTSSAFRLRDSSSGAVSRGLIGSFMSAPIYIVRPATTVEFFIICRRKLGHIKEYLADTGAPKPFLHLSLRHFDEQSARDAAAGPASDLPETARSVSQDKLPDYLQDFVWFDASVAMELIIETSAAVRRLVIP